MHYYSVLPRKRQNPDSSTWNLARLSKELCYNNNSAIKTDAECQEQNQSNDYKKITLSQRWPETETCMLSPLSDRGRRRLKIRLDANFSYGHSKWISSGGEKFADFSPKRQSCLGAGAQLPLHRAFWSLIHYTHKTFAYIIACESSLAGLWFFRENISNIWLNFLEKNRSNLGAWLPTTTANIKILPTAWQVRMTRNVYRT